MADESMVPQGQEYGTRQGTKAAMRAAGIPAAGLAGSRRVPPAPSSPAASQASAAGAPALDFLMARQPTYPQDYVPADPLAQLRNLAVTSPNSLVRDLLTRTLGG